ncbi:Fringe-like protein [Dioscorea alata]|uniref:Fringe-like protein n=1 Tax=Dioscorea alata TaxID=55571 RepID=A0ACB7TY72_DIOAL|nr:Fringe-like protein [Dioscorea alata]
MPVISSAAAATARRRLFLLVTIVAISLLYLLLSPSFPLPFIAFTTLPPHSPTTLRHLLFGIASSSKSLPRRLPYLRLWYHPSQINAIVFLDTPPPSFPPSPSDPPIAISSDSSRFPYTFPGGLRSATRVARIARELVDRNLPDIHWIVLGDDDTVFFPQNLLSTLNKYDWTKWYYVGARSESVWQNSKHWFGMAFGGGGFAISYPLARALAKVLDSCLNRYGHLYGSDDRVYACLVELGIELSYEPGFHQVDLRGNLFGLLSAHSLTPLVSLHHVDAIDPIFPSMNRSEALKHLFEAVKVDSGRVLQQTVCYDQLKKHTISVSWGYAIQVFEGNQLLPDILSLQHTFTPWKRNRNPASSLYMFNTRETPKDACKRPAVFFLQSVSPEIGMIESNYSRFSPVNKNCSQSMSSLQQIRVSSQKLNTESLQGLRRHCCDVFLHSSAKIMDIKIRKCDDDELIAMTL